MIDPSFVRNRALTYISPANAHKDIGGVDASAEAIRKTARLAASCGSDRLVNSIVDARHGLTPWKDQPTVRNLGEELNAYGFTNSRT